jgi:ribosome recycling factor
MSVTEVLRDTESRMKKSLEAAGHDFATLRTGRANPSLLDSLKVDYYGQTLPVNQLGSVTAPEPRLLVIQPWDKGLAGRHRAGDHEIGPRPHPLQRRRRDPSGHPPLTEERRRDFVKQLKQKAEAAGSRSATSAATPTTTSSGTKRLPTTK